MKQGHIKKYLPSNPSLKATCGQHCQLEFWRGQLWLLLLLQPWRHYILLRTSLAPQVGCSHPYDVLSLQQLQVKKLICQSLHPPLNHVASINYNWSTSWATSPPLYKYGHAQPPTSTAHISMLYQAFLILLHKPRIAYNDTLLCS